MVSEANCCGEEVNIRKSLGFVWDLVDRGTSAPVTSMDRHTSIDVTTGTEVE